jgi:hypothetical protein
MYPSNFTVQFIIVGPSSENVLYSQSGNSNNHEYISLNEKKHACIYTRIHTLAIVSEKEKPWTPPPMNTVYHCCIQYLPGCTVSLH